MKDLVCHAQLLGFGLIVMSHHNVAYILNEHVWKRILF